MHIHILGIAGIKTAALAKILKQLGHQVTGSDQKKIYPPVSTIFKDSGITINNTPITSDINLAIIGNSYSYFKNTVAEFAQIQSLNIPYLSYTEYLTKYLIKEYSILVAGSVGKTTITGLLSHVFLELKLDPSFMFGGEANNGFGSTRFGKSFWSIVEADENHTGLDTQTTFLYYPVKYLILTSTRWEHKESYPNAQSHLLAFQQLISRLPPDGVLVYNPTDPNVNSLLSNCRCPSLPYSPIEEFTTHLLGQHNQENIAAVVTLCRHFGFDSRQVTKAISSFLGIKRRLEIISQNNNILLIDDFAQSAPRVRSALDAVKFSFPKKRIFVYFEPHASFLQNKTSLIDFHPAFTGVDHVIIGKLSFTQKVAKNLRTTAKDWVSQINPCPITYLPQTSDIISFFKSNLLPGDILIHFSSGGLEGLNTLNTIKGLY